MLLAGGGGRASEPYGIRKNFLDTYISVATSAGCARDDFAHGWTARRSAGLPLRQPTRWSIVTHLVERGAARRATR